MAKTKISEFSSTAASNTDIDGINIAEGCAPSGINDAIRELMAQLKDFQTGAAGDPITVVGTLAAKGTSASAADVKLYEDTDNGTNYVALKSPAALAADLTFVLPSTDGTANQALKTDASGNLGWTSVVTPSGAQTITDKTYANAVFDGSITEDVFTLTGTALNPANGTIQTITLGSNTTFTDSLSTGQSMILGIDDGTAYSVTWPTITWTTTPAQAPTLATSGFTWVVLWKVGTTLYGKY